MQGQAIIFDWGGGGGLHRACQNIQVAGCLMKSVKQKNSLSDVQRHLVFKRSRRGVNDKVRQLPFTVSIQYYSFHTFMAKGNKVQARSQTF